MAYRAILFDMDGTLVPLDMDAFMKVYFKELSTVVAPLGISFDGFVYIQSHFTWLPIKNISPFDNVFF